MKKLLLTLLIMGGVSLIVSGCQTKHEANEHPTAEHPAKAEAPKDHPAH